MFKKLILSASLLFASHVAFSQGVAINEDNSSANASAILDIKSTTKGMLAPRMSAAQKTAISSPATGLLIYQTDGTAGFYYYNGTVWTFINAAGVAGQDGLNSLSKTTTEPAGANCTNGGIKVEYGLDINSNGTLDTGEENATLTKFVCNGADGATGVAGQGVPTGGTTGQVLTKVDGTNYNTQWATAAGGGASGLTLKDANNTVLGEVLLVSPSQITVLSSTGYIYNVQWDGTFRGEQIYYSTTGCNGTRMLNGSVGSARGVKYLVYDGASSGFYTVANPNSSGVAIAVDFFSATNIWALSDQNCGSTSTSDKDGWILTSITKATAGVPTTIVGPLTIE
ncbi:hypothetical protein ACE193_02735 [Bernardetia sp. OM2101]|uniref:DUF7151 family protein n=1 Tax=Bernardetia sp. OM2101 TaxID=3344876 RepID=UPI0035D0F35A